MAELVKADPCARATGLNKHTLYKLAAVGSIPCYRAGRALRFDIAELREWMRTQATGRIIGSGGKGRKSDAYK